MLFYDKIKVVRMMIRMKDKLEYGKYVELRDNYEGKVSRLANIRMVMFIIMITSFILKYYYYKLLLTIVFAISLVSFIIMVIVSNKYFKIYDYYFFLSLLSITLLKVII